MHVRPSNYGRRKLASAPPPEISLVAPETGDFAAEQRGIRKMIWIYFWLLIFEGALRKWITPQLADPLLIVRDPVVVLIYLMALSRGLLPMNGFTITWIVLAFASAVASLFIDGTNYLVTLFGLRTSFLHLPLIFLMGQVFDRRDAEKFARWFLLLAIPMALLVVLQFRAPSSAWINAAVGGSEGQLTVGFDKIRPPGVFSFTSGLAAYLGMVAAFLLSYFLKPWPTKKWITGGALVGLCLMAAVSGSRGALVGIVLILAAVAYACLRQSAFVGAGMRTAILIAIVFSGLTLRHEVRMGLTVHESRIESGGGVRGGLIDRALTSFTEPFHDFHEIPLLGRGIGLGTTAAGGLLHGQRTFVLAEGEWRRVVLESGPILGFIYLGSRVLLTFFLLFRANRALEEDGDPLALLLFAAVAPNVLVGQLGVPTILGFAAFGAGVCLAAARSPHRLPAAVEGAPAEAQATLNPNRQPTVRGRSIYAEKLHGR